MGAKGKLGTMMNGWLMGFTPTLLAVAAVFIARGGTVCRSYWVAWCGLATTMAGDYFLVVQKAPLHSNGFLFGVAGFALAHVLWIAFFRRHGTMSPRIAVALLFSLGILFGARLVPALHSPGLSAALGAYMVLSVVDVSYACGTHRLSRAWRYGLCLLLLSDTLIGFGHILGVPRLGPFIGVTYLASLLCIAVAIMRCGQPLHGEGKIRYLRRVPIDVLLGGGAVAVLFLLAMVHCPGSAYNPFMRMLSYLGRTKVNGVDYPACHYFFTCGMALSAGLVGWFYPALSCFVKGERQKVWLLWCGVFNAAGLLTIAFVPENVWGFFHNVGCWAAALGGVGALLVLTPGRCNPRVPGYVRWGWLAWGSVLTVVFEVFLISHALKRLPFSPYVPTCQKILILTFMAWLVYYAVLLFRRTRRLAWCASERSCRKSDF